MSDLENLITKIITYTEKGQKPSIHKFDKNWILRVIEENEEISKIHQYFQDYDQRGVDIIDFVKIFLNIVSHAETETIYIVIGLVELFKDICDSLGLTTHVTSNDVLNFIVDTFIYASPVDNHVLETRKLPPQKHFNQSETKIRDIEINAPVVYGEFFDPIKRLVKSKMISDSLHHVNNSVKEACYASEIKKIFCLDLLSDYINIYNTECKFEKKITSKAFDEVKDAMILNFAWSNKQLRLGACLKDFSLAFWDASDNFEFQKTVVLGNSTSECQSNIWYIEFLNSWVTTDQTNALNVWDLLEDRLLFSLSSERANSTIIELVPMEIIKLVAAASIDKKVTVWDFAARSMILEIKIPNGGVHSMVFSATFQTLITAGFENSVLLWEISPHYFDYTLRGRLMGHKSMITAVQVIERTPMLLTADDTGHMKVWDIRTFSCLQTLSMGPLTVVTCIIDMYEIGKLGFSGTRVNLLDFEDAFEVKNKFNAENQLWPIRVEYNPNTDELIVCTRKELQFIDINTGRVKKIFSGLLTNSEDEITAFRLVHQSKKFILGDQHGRMGLYLYSTGEFLKTLKGHTNEITSIKADYANKTIISSSLDSSIIIQKENRLDFEVKRKLINGHYRKEIVLMETSVYHNLIITGTRDNILYVWDYEYARLIGSITIEDEAEPTAIHFISGYAIIIISTTYGTIHFFHFFKKDSSTIQIKNIGLIDVDQKSKKTNVEAFFESRGTLYANKLLVDLHYDPEGIKKPEEALLYTSLNDGSVIVFDIKSLFDLSEIVLVGHANVKKNYNAGRTTSENFEEAIKIYKIYHAKLNSKSYNTGQPPPDSMVIPTSPQGHKANTRHTFSAALQQFSSVSHPAGRQKLESKNKASFFKPTSGIDDYSRDESATESIANASELDIEREKTDKTDKFFDFSKQIKVSFKAHKDTLTTLLFMTYPDKKLLTGAHDSYVKIWELNGELIASMNVNYPLPMVWKIQAFSIERVKKQILYGVKIIETIFKRYKGKILLSEEKKININHFLHVLEQSSSASMKNPDGVMQVVNSVVSKPVLMEDEYEPRDLRYNKVKGLYKNEIRGNTLKELEFIKGLMVAQDFWKENKKQFTNVVFSGSQFRYDGEIDIMSYLIGDQKAKLDLPGQNRMANETKHLAAKLDAKLASLRRNIHLNTLPLDKERSNSHKTAVFNKMPSRALVAETVSKSKFKSVKSRITDEDSSPKTEPLSALSSSKLFFSKESKAQAIPEGINNKELHQKTQEPQSPTSLLGLNLLEFNKKNCNSQKSVANSIDVITESLAEDHKKSALIKKRSLPSISFYEYAGQKNLVSYTNSPAAGSKQSNAPSSNVAANYKKNLRKNELRGILFQLDYKLKQAQLSNSTPYVQLSKDFENDKAPPSPFHKKTDNHNNSSITLKYPKIGSKTPSRPDLMKRPSIDFKDRFRKFAESELRADRSRDVTRNDSQLNHESLVDNSIKADFSETQNIPAVKAYDLWNVPHRGDASQTQHSRVGKSFDSAASSIKNTTSKLKGSLLKDTLDSFSELGTDNLFDFPPSKFVSRDKISHDDPGSKSP